MSQTQDLFIDFSKENWSNELNNAQNKNIKALKLVNFNPTLDLPEVEFESVKDVYFIDGRVEELPHFIQAHKINLLSFLRTEFSSESINTNILKSVKRIGIHGESIKIIPKGLFLNNDIEFIFITQTNIKELDLSQYELVKLREITIQGNDLLESIQGSLGIQESLEYIDLFGCPFLTNFDISEYNRIKKLRIGSWTDSNPVSNEFKKLKYLQEVTIDNYRTDSISIDFLIGKAIWKLKIYCPSKENIATILGLQNLNKLEISRQINCSKTSLHYAELSTIKSLKELQLNLGGNCSISEFKEYIGKFENLEYVQLIDTYWKENGYAQMNKVKVYINN